MARAGRLAFAYAPNAWKTGLASSFGVQNGCLPTASPNAANEVTFFAKLSLLDSGVITMTLVTLARGILVVKSDDWLFLLDTVPPGKKHTIVFAFVVRNLPLVSHMKLF